jgi:hypothetical protein
MEKTLVEVALLIDGDLASSVKTKCITLMKYKNE